MVTGAISISFSHVHLYADKLDDLSSYKKLEDRLNELSKQLKSEKNQESALDNKKRLWWSICHPNEENVETSAVDSHVPGHEFVSQNRDVVRQLLAGMGFRITGSRYPSSLTRTNTRSVLVTSKDPDGIQMIVTAIDPEQAASTTDPIHHFDAARVRTFYEAHQQRQGVAVLGFAVDNVEHIFKRYESLHPKLISHYQTFSEEEEGSVKVLEVFAFYQQHEEHDEGMIREADHGTILRFTEIPPNHPRSRTLGLPGLIFQTAASFDETSVPAYSDHWVSNVFSRTEFLDILRETVDFHPKVDFNAGVVAAGEAQIESTVTGNESAMFTDDPSVALRDQSQVYLPINNALSEVGHVHVFLKEIGQGIQHVASRVEDLVSFVQSVNDNRQVTGEGFTFLKIPRSYYGVLTLSDLSNALPTKDCALEIWNVLDQNRLLAHDGAVDLSVGRAQIDEILTQSLSESAMFSEYVANKDNVLQVILRSRYKNLYSLLRDHLSEERYLGVVRNQILVDIQGEDLLYQIFTCKILQREPTDEAPFLEFIQRVCSRGCDENGCSQEPIRPGCGGFGIRNFLTLFLSIEVSKAMQEVANAKTLGDEAKQEYEQMRVDYFTAQLNESNPILTEISDAMTDEGHLQQKLAQTTDQEEIESLKSKLRGAEERKRKGSAKLMMTSAKYKDLMKALRKTRI